MNTHLPVPFTEPGTSTLPGRDGREASLFRLWLLSDLRVHEHDFALPSPPPDFDALVVAGGVRPGVAAAVHWLADTFDGTCGNRPIIFVPSGLEFEDGVPVPEALAQGEAAARERGVALLHDAGLRLGWPDRPGLHILGATMWPGFSLDAGRAGEARGHGRHRWRGCRLMRSAPGTPFLPHDAVGAHARSEAYVEDALRTIWVRSANLAGAPTVVGPVQGGDRAVVVTGFPPLRACLPPALARPLRDPWAPNWAVSDLGRLLEGYGAPEAWLHGGVPNALDMRVGRSRVAANPFGHGDPTGGFDVGRVIVV